MVVTHNGDGVNYLSNADGLRASYIDGAVPTVTAMSADV